MTRLSSSSSSDGRKNIHSIHSADLDHKLNLAIAGGEAAIVRQPKNKRKNEEEGTRKEKMERNETKKIWAEVAVAPEVVPTVDDDADDDVQCASTRLVSFRLSSLLLISSVVAVGIPW